VFLSIPIPTLGARRAAFDKLYAHLEGQINQARLSDAAEIVFQTGPPLQARPAPVEPPPYCPGVAGAIHRAPSVCPRIRNRTP